MPAPTDGAEALLERPRPEPHVPTATEPGPGAGGAHAAGPVAQSPLPPTPPPPIGPLEAALRHPFLAAFPLVLLVGAAVALALVREPVYTAETRLNVGRGDVSPEAVGSVAVGNQSLAAAYSRAVQADGVVAPVARRLDLDPKDVRLALRASPLPESPVIRLTAKADDEAGAVWLANGAADRLIAFVRSLGRDPSAERSLLRRYRAARLDVAQARARRAALELGAGPVESRSERRRRAESRAAADLATAELRAESLAEAYRSNQQLRSNGDLVQVLVPATTATSDARPTIQRYVLMALAGGLFAGLGLAVVRANLARRRRWRA